MARMGRICADERGRGRDGDAEGADGADLRGWVCPAQIGVKSKARQQFKNLRHSFGHFRGALYF